MPPRGILNAIKDTLLSQVTLQLSTTTITAPADDIIITEEYPPSTMGKLVSEILSIFQDVASYTTPHPIQEAFNNYTQDKSQAELCFLCTVIIVVVLFVIVLPALEAFFLRDDTEWCGCDGEEEEEFRTEEDILRYYYLTQREEEQLTYSSLEMKHHHQMSTMRVYKPGRGVVQMSMEEVIEMTSLLRECSSSSSGSSTETSGSMQTIYEEEEEEEEHEEYDLPTPTTPTSSPPSTPERMDDVSSRMMDDVLRKKLFHHADTRPPLLSSNHAPQ
jgi:hypothetical protein